MGFDADLERNVANLDVDVDVDLDVDVKVDVDVNVDVDVDGEVDDMQAAGESVERKEANGHEPIASCLLHAAAIFAECHREKTSGQ